MTYEEAKTYFRQIQTGAKIKPGLTVTRTLMQHLGNPQDRLSFIHIAGTNGKGSTASFLCSMYAESGLKVGRYVSPVVFSEFEKIQFEQAGRKVMITEEEMAECLTKLRDVVETMQELGEGIPTEFELDTAAAFLAFDRWQCDLVVLETGMGGRLDATNVICTTACAVITPIARDHMQFLGDTIQEIAAEKAGIIKDRVPVVTCQHEREAQTCLEQTCEERKCVMHAVSGKDIDIRWSTLEGTRFCYKQYQDMTLCVPGVYQVENACLALECVELLQNRYPVSEEQIRKGLEHTVWRGRFEVLRKNPLVIVDGAHNPDGMRQFLASVDIYLKDTKKIGIMGVFADKEYRVMAELLGERFLKIYTIMPPSERGLPAEELAAAIGKKATACATLEKAVDRALSEAKEQDAALLLFGSLSFLKDILYNGVGKESPMNKTVIFDMDGVIFDTEALFISCWKMIGEKYALGEIEEVCHKCIGTTSVETKRIVLEKYGQNFEYEKFCKEASVLFHKKIDEKGIPVKRGARELLSYLKVNGFRIGLASSTRKQVIEEELEEAGLLSFFHVIVGGDMVEHSKPDPEIYLLACQEMGVNPAETFAIEDSFNGVRAASRAGMKVFMVPDLLEPDDEMRELASEIYPSLMGVLGFFQSQNF